MSSSWLYQFGNFGGGQLQWPVPLQPIVQCLARSFCRNTFHSTSSTTTVKITIPGESIQKEFQIMIMKKMFGKNKKNKFVNFFSFLLIFKNVQYAFEAPRKLREYSLECD